MPTPFVLTGVLKGTSFIVENVNLHFSFPISITLNSAAAGRSIRVATDTELFAWPYDVVSPTMLVLFSNVTIGRVEFVGQVGDTWGIK